MIEPDEAAQRAQIVAVMQRMEALGLNRGSTGNASLWRPAEGEAGAAMLITPTGMPAADLTAADLVWMDDTAQGGAAVRGRWAPSSEWHFHRAIYRARPELRAVVHMHATHATALACLRRGLPAFHYMVAVAGGDSVPCTPYHLFGTEALSQAVAEAMRDRQACLMANHGLVAAGATPAQALKVAVEIEALCEAYLKALAVGEPALLSREQMAEVIERFRTYGQPGRMGA